MEHLDLAETVAGAAAGDESAWERLVDRFSGLLWAVARSHRLANAEAADVIQATWLRLIENLDRIRDPNAIGAWLATTARRECLRTLHGQGREMPVDEDDDRPAEPTPQDSPEDALLQSERDALLWQALDGLSPRCARLLRVLMASPPPSYAEVASSLDMPIGSIGPTRARCLDCLRRETDRLGLTVSAAV